MSVPLAIRQSSSMCTDQNGKPTDLWDWDLWLSTPEPSGLDGVARVVYSLPSVFPNPNRIVHDRASGFRFSVRSRNAHDATWGTVRVRLRIVCTDGSIQHDDALLDLRDAAGGQVRDLLELPEPSTLNDYLRLVKRLKAKGAFREARAVLQRAEAHPEYAENAGLRETLLQQRVLCTYKDPSLPLDTRLAEARDLIARCEGGLDDGRNPETLGIAGAIYKRLWEVDGQRANLERAFRLYRQGYAAMLKLEGTDQYDGGGYTGGNATFVADLICDEERRSLGAVGGNGSYAAEARRIRTEAATRLAQMQANSWWHRVSLVELHLGLAPHEEDRYDKALAELATAMAIPDVPDWERESTATQLSALVEVQLRLYGERAARGWQVVSRLVPENPAALQRLVRGKVGLALSGGGFRAALYHIGVLARLAERDLLRDIEVISCVSGGSIVGAHYYLELRHLLQTKTDAEIDATDYVRIVQRLEDRFRAGVQTNIRMRVAGSALANWQMIFRPTRYSRTRRTGELYESCIFNRVEDGEGGADRWLNDLFVSPLVDQDGRKQRSDGFSPRLHNWRRRAKVPILVLNATTLNSGRNWQFTASSMGESASYGATVDATERYDVVYYSEAPEAHRGFRLGHAVAASSCVPGLFDPLVIEGLFADRVIRLVDGGVHDNQGTRALLDHDCTVLLVSDASGQMGTELDPSNASLGVVLRTNSVLQARVRVAQHQEIEARRRSALVREEMLVHLKQDLESPVIAAGPLSTTTVDSAASTSYGIRQDMQTALAAIRTDLDSFTDREAYGLMTSGYRATERALGRLRFFAGCPDQRAPWRFLAVEPALQGRENGVVDPAGMLRHLQVGSKLALKVWSLHPMLRLLGWAILVALAGGVIAAALAWRSMSVRIDLVGLLIAAGVFALGLYSKAAGRAADLVMKVINFRSTVARILVGIVMGTLGGLVTWVHLQVFDRLFKRLGRVTADPATAVPLDPEGA